MSESEKRATVGWLLHALGQAEGLAANAGDPGLAKYINDQAWRILSLPGEDLPTELPRGMGAEIATALHPILELALSPGLSDALRAARERAIALELARAHRG